MVERSCALEHSLFSNEWFIHECAGDEKHDEPLYPKLESHSDSAVLQDRSKSNLRNLVLRIDCDLGSNLQRHFDSAPFDLTEESPTWDSPSSHRLVAASHPETMVKPYSLRIS